MLNCYPGLVSPADLRHLKEILAGFGVEACLLPDYSETLDRPILAEYETTPPGGAPLERIRRTPSAIATLSLGATTHAAQRGGALLSERFGVPERVLGLPIGVAETDRFVAVLEEVTGNPAPAWLAEERGRLIDAYVDAHKYVFGKRAAVYGGEDFVVGVASFLGEIGVTPVICASGGKSGRLREAIGRVCPEHADQIRLLDGVDFADIEEEARGAQLHLVVGNSKGYALARRLDLPLMRLGFPIHDRVGGQRLLHVGYRGAQQVFDFVVNRLIAAKQDSSPVGYLNM
jgi:nitrogenase molybdenum-iron protein NifN